MKTQSIIFSKANLFFQVKNIIKLITWKNIWNLLGFSVVILGIICGLWIILTTVGSVIIAGWAIAGTTSFSGDDSLSRLTVSFWQASLFEKTMIIALAVNSVNYIAKSFACKKYFVNFLNKMENFFEK